MAKVLRAFDYSFDGVTALKAKVGDFIDFGDMTAGLEAEGYIEPGEEPEALSDAPVQSEPEVVVAADEPPVATDVVEEVVAPVAAEVELAQEPAPKTRKRK